MGMDIRVWGNAGWTLMYAIAFAYPKAPTSADADGAVSFFRGLGAVLPCKDCRSHFAAYMQQFPIERNVDSRDKLSAWVLKLNNAVNARLGKPQRTIQDVWDAYNARHYGQYVLIALALLGVCCALSYLIKRK